MRVLVMGAGGIGGTVVGHLAEIEADVTAVTTNERIAEAVRQNGFRLQGDAEPRAVKGRIEVGIPEGETYDLVLLATQPPQVEEAARQAAPHLADGGNMMCFQNGLCEERVANIVGGPERVIGGVVSWGASMPEPGLYDKTSSGGFTLGRLNGDIDDAVRAAGNLLEAVGPVAYTGNLRGARWSKLAINCGISSLGTIGGERLGPLVRVRRVRRLCLEVFSEVVAVARALDVQLEKVAGTVDLEWLALSDAERQSSLGSPGLTAKHAVLLAVGMRYRRLRSSMLSAIERGRPPSVDFLNGEVATRARKLGIEAPVNQRIVDTIHDIAAGRRSCSRDLLDEIFEQTRSTP